jgi:hypothetical protein
MARMPNTLGPLVAYHGCDFSVAQAVMSREQELLPSVNNYDWLGYGVYFWVDSPDRALNWAEALARRSRSTIKHPAAIGALIYPGLCLNLTDYGVFTELQRAHRILAAAAAETGIAMPKNAVPRDGVFMRRNLDCAVINMMHQLRHEAGFPPYDSVYGVFEEGGEVYPGSGFRLKTHVQLAVLNHNCIIGYFSVRKPQNSDPPSPSISLRTSGTGGPP